MDIAVADKNPAHYLCAKMSDVAEQLGTDVRENIIRTAGDAVANLAYTVVFDICNEMISSGANQEATLECANTVVNKYVEGGIKIRKKPAPRAKTLKATTEGKPVDALTAASRKLNNLGSNVLWIHHPNSSEYSYTTSIKLATGYPVRNNMTHKVCYVVTEEDTVPLTVKDARVAMSMGLEVDYDSVQQQ